MNEGVLARRIVDGAARTYRGRGLSFAAHHYYWFARGKLGMDPIYFALLRRGFVREGERVLDLGCGLLLIAPLLRAARASFEGGEWFERWPDPPAAARVHGIELRESIVAAAGRALGGLGEFATIERGDLRSAVLPANDVTVMMDVIHYLEPAAQEDLLARIRDALAPGGRFVTRVADTGGGWRYHVTRLGDQSITLLRGLLDFTVYWPRFHPRPIGEWRALLERLGFSVETEPMSAGTPFANVMIVARRN